MARLSLEIAVHCYRYPRLLARFLSALILHPPQTVDLLASIYYAPADAASRDTVRWFRCRYGAFGPDGACLVRWRPLPIPRLCRRAIGRNLACRSTCAEWLWLADADYLCGPGSLDALAAALAELPSEVKLAYPRQVLASVSHEVGDADIAEVDLSRPRLIDLPYRIHFRPHPYDRAIGGVQIVRGSVARAEGYLPGHPVYQQPADTWQRTREDVAFRRQLGTRGVPISVPGLFRIRHSERGRENPEVVL